MAAITILSPHLDDAVCSCWHLVNQPGAEVITLFAGIPADSVSTLWDRLCGEPNGAKMMQQRLKENDKALKSSDALIRNLNFLDRQYRPDTRNISEIAESILAISS